MLYIFDWDGTLSDSTGTIVVAMQRAAEDIGWSRPDDDTVRNIIGLGLPEALRVMYPNEEPKSLESIRDRYRHHYLELDRAKPAEFYPKVKESLDCLRSEGHILAVATGKSRQGLERILGVMGLSNYFHATRCADETASKPNPLMLEQLLAQFAVPAAEAVMVGDTEYDMDMGRRAGVARLAVSYGAHKPERLHPYEPELCMDCFSEILTWRRRV